MYHFISDAGCMVMGGAGADTHISGSVHGKSLRLEAGKLHRILVTVMISEWKMSSYSWLGHKNLT
jgi:hypothetical protein